VPFRPDWKLTPIAAVALVILLSLGTWQVRRNGETSAWLERVDARLDEPPLANAAMSGAPADLSWRTASLTGQYQGRPLLMSGRYQFGEVGFDLVQAFTVAGGPTILVNRGWIPRSHLQVAEEPPGTEVSGLLLHLDEFQREATIPPIPASDGLPERWPPDAYAAIARVVGAAPLLVVAGRSMEPGERKQPLPLPVTGWYARPETRPHLQYAATWYMIAGTLVAIWIGHGVQRGRAGA
jgi:surfeit locus 1 family protein